MIFGEGIGESEGAAVVEQRVSVVMSPQHTKAFLAILQDHVGKYEKLFGEIKWQPSDQAPEKNGRI